MTPKTSHSELLTAWVVVDEDGNKTVWDRYYPIPGYHDQSDCNCETHAVSWRGA